MVKKQKQLTINDIFIIDHKSIISKNKQNIPFSCRICKSFALKIKIVSRNKNNITSLKNFKERLNFEQKIE